MLGLSVTAPAGRGWRLAPAFGDLGAVEGGFTTGLGKFSAKWSVRRGSDGTVESYVLEWSVPQDTTGEVVLPCPQTGALPRIEVDGEMTENKVATKRGATGGESIVITGHAGSHRAVVSGGQSQDVKVPQ